MKKLMITMLLLTSMWAVAQTNVVQEGYYEMVDETGNVFDSKASEREAIQGIYNYYISTGKKATYNPPKIRIDFDEDFMTIVTDTVYLGSDEVRFVDMITVSGIDYKVSEIEYILPKTMVDTIQVTECWDRYTDKIWLHKSTDTNIYPHDVFIPFIETSLIPVQVDSLPDWKKMYQHKWTLERTKHYETATTKYKEIAIPFQFLQYGVESITSSSANFIAHITHKQSNIKAYVENVLIKEFNPGFSEQLSEYDFMFNFAFPNLILGDNLVRVEVISENGDTDTVEFNIRTSL